MLQQAVPTPIEGFEADVESVEIRTADVVLTITEEAGGGLLIEATVVDDRLHLVSRAEKQGRTDRFRIHAEMDF